ncbi:MAG: Uma2 family endonuclease [Ruminiclostridium sp.]|jgi:Uma2 family endonuclease|nr:Uma2 family endonuclease [Ruminiclostridium sp.]
MTEHVAYQDERREELIDGKIVAMSPASTSHTYIADGILSIFRHYLRGRKCIPFGDGLLVHLTDQDKFVPDVMIVCDRNKIGRNGIHGAPDLVVEVLSPSTAKKDRGYKKAAYESSGVPEYWIVNPADKSIEVYLLEDGRYTLDNVYTRYPDEDLAEMTDEEKAAVITEFKCHLYDDLVIRLDDIFGDWF